MQVTEKRVSIHWVKAILAAAQSLGIEADAVLAPLGLTLDLDHNQPAYLSLDQTQAIWRQAEQLSQHDYFGLLMGQRVRPSYFHAVAYVAMTSSDLLTAYRNFTHYMPLISEGAEMALEFEGDFVWLKFTPKPDNTPFSRHQHESVMALLLAFSRWMVGRDDIYAQQVNFVHPSGPSMDEYISFFGTQPKFKQPFSGVKFKKSLLKTTLLETDTGLHALHKAHADQLLADHLNASWQVKVMQVFNEAGHFNLNREQVASQLHMSTRTLQRRLQEEGTSFLEVVDQMRKQKAQQLICANLKSLKEVAQDLGFSESSTFYRACGRWFSQTPNQMRQGAKNQLD